MRSPRVYLHRVRPKSDGALRWPSPRRGALMPAGIGITTRCSKFVLLGGTSHSSAYEHRAAGRHPPSRTARSIGGTVIAILLMWPCRPPAVRIIPGPLVAIAGATVLALLPKAQTERIDLQGNFFDAIGLAQNLPECPEDSRSLRDQRHRARCPHHCAGSQASNRCCRRSRRQAASRPAHRLQPRWSVAQSQVDTGGRPSPKSSCAARQRSCRRPNPDTRSCTAWILLFCVTVHQPGGNHPGALAGLLIVIGAQLYRYTSNLAGAQEISGITPSPSCVGFSPVEGVHGLVVAIGSCWCGWCRPSRSAGRGEQSKRWRLTIDAEPPAAAPPDHGASKLPKGRR